MEYSIRKGVITIIVHGNVNYFSTSTTSLKEAIQIAVKDALKHS